MRAVTKSAFNLISESLTNIRICITIMFRICLIIICFAIQETTQYESFLMTTKGEDDCVTVKEISAKNFKTHILPNLEGKHKGEAGKIGIIGGSTEYTGAPYFSAISALKVGADLVYVITTESAAPVIKSYSPDLIVYPYLHQKHRVKIVPLLNKMDVIVIGPGLGRENDTMSLIYDIIRTCKVLPKPLIIDADGLYALSKDTTVLLGYPSPGVILTPNYIEAERLKMSVPSNATDWHRYWGENVSILLKGHTDTFYSSIFSLQWHVVGGGSGRRAGGQGDILAGSLATFVNWALKSNLCANKYPIQLAHSIATYTASNLTRVANFKAFVLYGRSLLASDMINQLHDAFECIMTHV